MKINYKSKCLLFILILLFSNKILSQDTAKHYVYSGYLKASKGNYKEALIDYDKAIKMEPNNNIYYISRASVKNELGNYYGAINDCNLSIKLQDGSYHAYYIRAFAWNKLGENEHALIDLNTAIQRDSQSILYFFRAKIYIELERFNDACNDINYLLNENIEDTGFRDEINELKNKHCK